MYEINYDNFKSGYRRKIFHLVLVGLLFLLIIFSIVARKAKVNDFDGETLAYNITIEESVIPIEMESSTVATSFDIKVYKPTYYYSVNSVEYSFTPREILFINKKKLESINKIYYDTKSPEIAMAESQTKMPFYMKIVMLVPFALAYAIYLEIQKLSKRVETVKNLAEHGVLIERIKYRIKLGYGLKKNLYVLLVSYETRAGKIVELASDPRYDHKMRDEDRLVDLLIDPNNEENYYIDFDINRKDNR